MKKIHILFAALLLMFPSCLPDTSYPFTYETIITDTPVNLSKINTEFDDYNTDIGFVSSRNYLYFSTNRNSSGDNFDFICEAIDISYHFEDDIFNFSFPAGIEYSILQTRLFEAINTSSDELGPLTYSGVSEYDYFIYANDEEEDFDLKFIYTLKAEWMMPSSEGEINGPFSISFANSDYDDLYPAIHGENSRFFFCSDRDNGQFDIYSTEIPTDVYLHDFFINTTDAEITKEINLSSDFNEKCPSISGNLLVFASDRPGGFGGYDLYYSIFDGTNWSNPVNLGNKINSPQDEYRPITAYFYDTDFMIFSSNRTGGKGGFDLYAVRTEDVFFEQ
ncbi:MAG: hypothetical protein GXY51_01565 [Bacteroidetes bacterium]|nr:hypothetical protein [Bacteroidota bacterium]